MEAKLTLTLTPDGRYGLGVARRTERNLRTNDVYMLAAWVEDEVGWLVRVVYDTWDPVAPEKAMDGMPSKAASEAAPL